MEKYSLVSSRFYLYTIDNIIRVNKAKSSVLINWIKHPCRFKIARIQRITKLIDSKT